MFWTGFWEDQSGVGCSGVDHAGVYPLGWRDEWWEEREYSPNVRVVVAAGLGLVEDWLPGLERWRGPGVRTGDQTGTEKYHRQAMAATDRQPPNRRHNSELLLSTDSTTTSSTELLTSLSYPLSIISTLSEFVSSVFLADAESFLFISYLCFCN